MISLSCALIYDLPSTNSGSKGRTLRLATVRICLVVISQPVGQTKRLSGSKDEMIRNQGAVQDEISPSWLLHMLRHEAAMRATLQPYLDTTADRLAGATEYLQSTTGLSPTALYTTAGAVVLLGAIPALAVRNGQSNKKSGIMRRYGFSTRGAMSPFNSQDGDPVVTDQDYSYITSADLEDHPAVNIPRRSSYVPHHSHFVDPYSTSAPSLAYGRHRPEDDVVLIKHSGVTYPEHFPAYSIGDGKLLVSDVRERVSMILDLSERQARRVKLYYKGRRLRNPDRPVREYGVKNNSEILMVLDDAGQGSSSDSGEEVVVVGRDGRERHGSTSNSPRLDRPDRWGGRSRRGSSAQVGLELPGEDLRRRGASRVRTQSPGSNVSVASAPPAPMPVGRPGGPIEKLNNIATEFNTKWRPLCRDYISRPPRDPKKLEDDHRKLSETVLQQIMKLDGIDTSPEEGARALRKELISDWQALLKMLDDAKRLG
ncbi:hypothetical protein N0V88_002142 [Collariella sp. IMI 366227]|nr:hypothetical protein N0V88_002142 [Collariella sp. IMI 366227]